MSLESTVSPGTWRLGPAFPTFLGQEERECCNRGASAWLPGQGESDLPGEGRGSQLRKAVLHRGVTASTAPSASHGPPTQNAHTRIHAHVHTILKPYFWLLGRRTCHFLCPRQPAGPASLVHSARHGAPSICIYIDKSARLIKVLSLESQGINKKEKTWNGVNQKLGHLEPKPEPTA